jgi:hypothetical protein
MASVVTLDDIIGDFNKDLVDIFKKDYRQILDQRISILDLSYEALKVNVYRNTKSHIDAYNSAYESLLKVLDRQAKRKYSSLDQVPTGYFQQKNFSYVYIDNGNSNRFIVANSFGALDTLVRNLSRDPDLIRTSFGTNTLFKEKRDRKDRPTGEYSKSQRRKSDIGHIATEGEENLISPLELKISDVLQFGRTTGNAAIEAFAKQALDDLYSIQAGTQYSFKNTAPEAVAAARNTLGTGYVVVTLHREKLNNKFSQEEARIFFNLKNKIAKVLASKPFEQVSGSNNIIQDIEHSLLNTLVPAKYKKPSSHPAKSKTPKRIDVNANTKAKSTAIKVKKAKIAEEVKETFNLTNLQNLINKQLQNAISANMGDGSSRSLLNYRTGRLASSAKVEYMSQSRAGMTTAFYSYMKSPYATFSSGGQQQNPRSRDPKLLISKSIREIAAEYAVNKLRAVNV